MGAPVSHELVSDDGDAHRYDLNEREMMLRTSRLLDEIPPATERRYVCYELDSPEIADVARTIERTVFETSFDNGAGEMTRIYGPYEAASRFLLSVDQIERRPVGALRIISNSPAGLMTLNTLPADATPMSAGELLSHHGITSLDDCWDVGTVAVMPEYRRQGKGISVQLYRGLYVSATNEGIEHMTSIIDLHPYETMTKYLGIPFVPLGGSGPFSYEGSEESVAVYGHIPDFYPKMRRKSMTAKGLLARKALWPLVFGTEDDALLLGDGYKN